MRDCFHSWRMTERHAAEIKDGSSETTQHPFSFFPADTVATQSCFSCHLEKLMEFTLHQLFPDTVVYSAVHLQLGHLLVFDQNLNFPVLGSLFDITFYIAIKCKS